MRIGRVLSMLFVLVSAAGSAAAGSFSTTVFGLPIAFEDCRARVAPALAGEGFGGTRDFGNGLLGFRGEESVSVACVHGAGETVVVITTSSCATGDSLEQTNRLARRMRGEAASPATPPSQPAQPAQPTPPSQPAQPSPPPGAGCTFNYKGWDGSNWTATLSGSEFQHAPNGDRGRMHRDSIIRYLSWDNARWTAKVVNGRFVHAPNEDWNRAHDDAILNYLDWSGARGTVNIRDCAPGGGSAPQPPQQPPPAHSASGACTFHYKGWDGSNWAAKLAGSEFQHAPNGEWGRMHRDSIIRYISWDNARWTAKVVNGRFVHAPNEDWNRAHDDPILNYLDWSGARGTVHISDCSGSGGGAAGGLCDDAAVLTLMDEWLRTAVPPQKEGESLRYERWGRVVGRSLTATINAPNPPDTRLSRCAYLWERAGSLRSTNLGTLREYVESRRR